MLIDELPFHTRSIGIQFLYFNIIHIYYTLTAEYTTVTFIFFWKDETSVSFQRGVFNYPSLCIFQCLMMAFHYIRNTQQQ